MTDDTEELTDGDEEMTDSQDHHCSSAQSTASPDDGDRREDGDADMAMSYDELREEVGLPESHTSDTTGVRVLGDVEKYPRINVLVGDVNSHGEVHATFEEHDSEVEIRQGTATINCDKGVIRLTDGNEWGNHVFSIDSLVSWYKPYEVFH
jgi:hypothetical protein